MFCRTFFGLTVLLCGLAFLDRALLVNYNFFTGIYNKLSVKRSEKEACAYEVCLSCLRLRL